MILYFSGTGNSKYVAKRIADALGDEIVNLNDRIKASDTSLVETGERVIIVTPTYAWRIPRVVRDWLLKTELRGARLAWFVMTCGSEIGNADQYNRELCAEKGLACMGTAQIVMPENYIAMFSAPQADKARQIVAQAEPSIDRAIAAIQANQPFAPTREQPLRPLHERPSQSDFLQMFRQSERLYRVKRLHRLRSCVKRCPMNNVAIKDGKPVWGKACTHCMACICYCPVSAIEYGKKSVGQPRYHFEAL